MLGGSPEFPFHCTMEGDKLDFLSLPSLGRGDDTVKRWAVIGERIFREEGGGGHGNKSVVSDCKRGVIGLLLRIVKYVDTFGDKGIFCPPRMHVGKHGNNVSTNNPTTVRDEQVKDIPRGNTGVEGVWVLETPDLLGPCTDRKSCTWS